MDYLGPHETLLENLLEHSRGEIYRSTGERRMTYMGQKVIDMSLIRMHFARGEISDRSFKCLDLTFFQQRHTRQHNPHLTAEEEKKAHASVSNDDASGSAAAQQSSTAIDYAKLGQAMVGNLGASLSRPCQEA